MASLIAVGAVTILADNTVVLAPSIKSLKDNDALEGFFA
jgi:hypothetical protein